MMAGHGPLIRSGNFREFLRFLEQEKMIEEAEAIAKKHFTSLEEAYLIKRGSNHVVAARTEIVQMLKRKLKKWSLPALGRLMGRDHTTIMYMLANTPRGGDKLAQTGRALVGSLPRCAECLAPATHASLHGKIWCGVHAVAQAKPLPHTGPLSAFIEALGEWS